MFDNQTPIGYIELIPVIKFNLITGLTRVVMYVILATHHPNGFNFNVKRGNLTMKDLINISKQQINQETVDTVSARELHGFLEVQSKFADWVTRRISEYGFVINKDYIIVSQKKETLTNNSEPRVTTLNEYHITLDMAKELSMVERNDKGREARQYFIECEKQLKEKEELDPMLMIAKMAMQIYESKRLAQDTAKRQDVLEMSVKEIQAKQEALTDCSNYYSVLAFSNLHDVGLTNGKLSAISRKAGKLSKLRGEAVGSISDPRWGKVKTYHKAILLELFKADNLL